MIRRHKGPRKVLVVHAHPVPQSFNTLLRDTTVRSLTESGHEVRSIDLYAEGFTPELSLDEHTNHLGPLADKPLIAAHAADLRWADALVLIYPTWWSGPPAMLKGWFDRVWANEVAFVLPEGSSRIKGTLGNICSLVVVTTHGSERLRNTLQRPGGRRMILRGLRILCAKTCRTRWVAMYGLDTANRREREEFVETVAGIVAEL